MKTISADEATRHFSTLLHDVATGEVVTVLSHGKPIATISPARPDDAEKEAAKSRLLERLRHQPPSGDQTWTRAELYEDAR